jgi:hypothetical protein
LLPALQADFPGKRNDGIKLTLIIEKRDGA